MKLTMADGWKQLHRKGTVIVASLFAAITAFGPTLLDAWNLLPQDLKNALPEGTARWVSTAAFLLLVLVRYTALRPRDKKEGDDATDQP
ncbi:hypothetical protein [Cupriavidus alkaliphilus]|uniref:DUF7940 domain-containing protein n=1 Tax=Cupriavidus alkaliphilus TaxID=942866 RepID=UPI001611701B|nr:hypothetical protein [Cupriavidus alkaliphilus]MBB3011617.1 hypothetical protein [Cupriavidus alkaliphilus]